jgi:integrase
MRLTDRTVTNNTPKLSQGKTDEIIFDDVISGFGVRLRKGGSRVWIYQYHLDGTKRMTLGPVSKIGATKARELVEEAAAKVALGHDPAAEKQEAQAHKETLGEAVTAYLKVKARELKPRTYVETERYLDETAKSLHGRPLAAIEQKEIADLLNKIAEESGEATANRFRANLNALYAWAAGEGKVTANPVAFTKKRKEQSRKRKLNRDELVAVWNALPDSDYGKIVKLLMLTGQRRNEIGGLRWSEIDLDKGEINLPAERTKNGLPHMVPISKTVRAILTAQSRMAERDHVFGRGDGDGFNGWSASKAALDDSLPKMDPWTLHDLRRTCATGMGELGVAPHIVELVLNHQSGHKGGIAGVYNHAVNGKERRAVLDQWDKHVMALIAAKPKLKAGGAKAGCEAGKNGGLIFSRL